MLRELFESCTAHRIEYRSLTLARRRSDCRWSTPRIIDKTLCAHCLLSWASVPGARKRTNKGRLLAAEGVEPGYGVVAPARSLPPADGIFVAGFRTGVAVLGAAAPPEDLEREEDLHQRNGCGTADKPTASGAVFDSDRNSGRPVFVILACSRSVPGLPTGPIQGSSVHL
jgi:hypothetical protein